MLQASIRTLRKSHRARDSSSLGAAWRQFSTQNIEAEEAKTIVVKHVLEGGAGNILSGPVLNTLFIDTLSLSKKFEDAGLSRPKAEELSKHITELILTNKIRMEDNFVAKKELERVVMEQEHKVMLFKAELLKAEDMAQAHVTKELDRQQSFLDKMRTEVRHEIDKLTSSQRLDMNLEKGRMRDDLLGIRDKTTELEIKVDRDINELKSSVEKAKNDTIKSVITILGTFSAIAFTISRFMQMGAGGGGGG